MSLREVIPSSFSSLLSLFGITLQSNKDNSFQLTGDVVPVAIVGSIASIQAISTVVTQDVPYTAGVQAGPVANTVLADTGPQPEGIYAVKVVVGGRYEGAGYALDWSLQRRDSANAANVWSQNYNLGTAGSTVWEDVITVKLLNNERLRVITIQASGNQAVNSNIWLQRIA